MKSNKLTSCFSCFSGYRCEKRLRLSRKAKKELKKFDQYVLMYEKISFCGGISSCFARQEYKAYKRYMHLTEYFKKNQKAFDLLIHNYYEEISIVLEDNTFKLHFHYDDDNGLYVSDGSMPFIYREEDFDETWAGSATKEVLQAFDIPWGSVRTDMQLIKMVGKHIPKTEEEYDEITYC